MFVKIPYSVVPKDASILRVIPLHFRLSHLLRLAIRDFYTSGSEEWPKRAGVTKDSDIMPTSAGGKGLSNDVG
jgi:hypothetical protein